MYTIKDLLDNYKEVLNLEIVAGEEGVKRAIRVPQPHRPGLSLAGFLKNYTSQRILIFGQEELLFLNDLDKETRVERLRGVITTQTPAVIVAKRYRPPKELIMLCEHDKVPLIRSSMRTMNLLSRLTVILRDEFSPKLTCHGTLVEAFGVGVLIQGESSIGKSEAALGLIERGHRLISDDIVRVKVKEGNYLEGAGPELTKHLLEIRGIGIINVAHLYGAVCVRDQKSIDLVVKLIAWNNTDFYDRVGLDQQYCDILGINIPYHTLPLKPGRDVVLLLETIALNHRLKEMGYHSAKEFNDKLIHTINRKQMNRRGNSEIIAKS